MFPDLAMSPDKQMSASQTKSSPAPKRRRLLREERKKELLDSAVRLAADIGLGKLVHAEIARTNNIAVATVFLYFPDAGSLVRAVVEEVGIFYREQCDQYLRGRDASPRDLQEYGNAFVESIDTHPQYAAVFLQWAAAVGNEHGIWDMFLEHINYLEKEIARRVKALPFITANTRAQRVETFVQLWLGSAFVIIRLKFSGASQKKLRQFLDQTFELLAPLSEK
jgi:AcrR family transcriptional regulator